jgi:hypothetical protein
MKRLLLILILTFNFQTLTNADDITDFQIEGISVGDSLIEFYDYLNLTEQIINDYPKTIYSGSDKFYGLRINKKLGDYDHFGVLLKKDDKKYIIYNLRGKKIFDNNLEDCKKYKEKVVNNFKDLLPNVSPYDYTHNYEIDNGKSVSYITDFQLKDKSSIRVYCDNWSTFTEKEKRWEDALNIEISTAESLYWLNNEAYK